MLEERLKISNLEERLKTEMVAGVLSGGTLPLPNSQLHSLVPTPLHPGSGPTSSAGSLPQSPSKAGTDTPPSTSPIPQEYSGVPPPSSYSTSGRYSPEPPPRPSISHDPGYSPDRDGHQHRYSPSPVHNYSVGPPKDTHVVYPRSPGDFQEGVNPSACQAGSD